MTSSGWDLIPIVDASAPEWCEVPVTGWHLMLVSTIAQTSPSSVVRSTSKGDARTVRVETVVGGGEPLISVEDFSAEDAAIEHEAAAAYLNAAGMPAPPKEAVFFVRLPHQLGSLDAISEAVDAELALRRIDVPTPPLVRDVMRDVIGPLFTT